MGERADQLSQTANGDDVLAAGDAEIQETREEIGQTLDAIEAKLAPERLTEDAKDAAMETVDHVVEEARATAKELSELASVAAMEAVDYALQKVKDVLPDLNHQAQDAARETVDHTIEEAKAAIQELGEQTRAAIRAATIGRIERMANTTSETSKYVGSTTIQTIRQNPGPAALTALGVGWLVMNGKSSSAQGKASQSTQSSGSHGLAGVGDQIQSKVGQVQQTAEDVTGQVQGGVSDAVDQVGETATAVAGQVQNTVTSAAGQVQDTAGQLVTQAQHMPSRFRHMIEQNPIPLGLVAVALGGAAALAMPTTRRENELLGEARDTLVDRAQTTAQAAVEKVQHVTEEVGETVEKEAKKEGVSKDSK